MIATQPHYLLFCDTSTKAAADQEGAQHVDGKWHFVLEQLDGPMRLEVADFESEVNAERLALLSVVRGLEALDQPSHVTLVTTSRYVSRGMRYGLSTWREADYKWERFGVQLPIRNADLWQRVDGALRFHGVKCRLIQSHTASMRVEADMALKPAVSGEVVASNPTVVPLPELVEAESAPKQTQNHNLYQLQYRENWWKLAAAWIKWWRGRPQFRPVFYGT